MSSTQQIIENSNYKRLEEEFPRLKNDRDHRRRFHEYLGSVYIRGVDKPSAYGELRQAYIDFKNS